MIIYISSTNYSIHFNQKPILPFSHSFRQRSQPKPPFNTCNFNYQFVILRDCFIHKEHRTRQLRYGFGVGNVAPIRFAAMLCAIHQARPGQTDCKTETSWESKLDKSSATLQRQEKQQQQLLWSGFDFALFAKNCVALCHTTDRRTVVQSQQN